MTTMLREWQVNIPTLAEIQSEIEDLRALIESLSVNVELDSHSVTAQQDQTEVEFPFSYDETSVLIIFRNGLLQRAGEQYDYVPVNNNKVSFNVPLEEGDVVTIIHISSSGPVGDTIGGGNGGSGNIDEDLRNLITQTATNLAKTNFKLNTHMTATRDRLSGLIIDVFNDTSGIDEEISRGWEYDPERKEIHMLKDLAWAKKSLTENAPSARYHHSLTYDSARGVVVLFGGETGGSRLNDTWEYDGTDWRQINTPTKPPARNYPSLTYDSARGVVVLFGGSDGSTRFNDTWEYDGTDWRQINTPTKPAARQQHSLTYDSDRGVVVLFGGFDGKNRFNDTWEYDGTDWKQVNTPTKPTARTGYSLTYDSARGVVVLFGGFDGSRLNDTWEYDGTDWREINTPTKPPARNLHSLTYDSDRGVVVLFGGTTTGSSSDNLNDIWEYDGTNWRQINTPTKPPARDSHSLTYDSTRGVVVLFGGDGGGYRNDTWEYDGTEWREIHIPTNPPARSGHSLTYDSTRGVVVLFGGSGGGSRNDTWEYDGTEWREIHTPTKPPARSGHSLTYDSTRGVVVMFGGSGDSGKLNDTWEYDGTDWREINTPTKPPARERHSLTYDSARGVVVMFGGNYERLDDTWEYDGTDWRQINTSTKPPARWQHSLTYDSARGVVVLFGGYDKYNRLDDTWEYDGTNWRKINTETKPPARHQHSLTYDSARGVVVLFGGTTTGYGDGRLNDIWEYDGTDWKEVNTPTKPPARLSHSITYDSARGVVVLFGGSPGSGSFNDTWEYWVNTDPAEVISSADILDSRPSYIYFVSHMPESAPDASIQYQMSLDDGKTWFSVSPEELIQVKSDINSSDPPIIRVKAIIPADGRLSGWAYGWV